MVNASRSVMVEEVPDELRSRIAAAAAQPRFRRIRRAPPRGAGDDAVYVVHAVAGDRVTIMELALRPDGSVAESTDSFTFDEIEEVVVGGGQPEGRITLGGSHGHRTFHVPAEVAEAALADR